MSLHVHIENATSLMPVFQVRPDQYEAALQRHPDVAARIRTTWGRDQDIYAREARTAEAMISYRFPKDTLGEDAPRLKLLQILGAGVDYLLPLDWVPPGVTVLTNSGAHVPKAGQSALMTLLMLNARLPELVTSQKRHEWNRRFTTTVDGKTVLIVGVGAIGGAAAKHARDFGMRVIGIRRSGEPHPHVESMHRPDELLEVLPEADFVLLNTALTENTRFFFGEREFAAMRRGASFANMSRGGLVDPAALDHALRSGHLAGAVIDVTYPEPPGADWPCWDTPNLIVTPHVLSDDIDNYIPRTLDLFFANLRRHFAGEPLTNRVDLGRSY
ncbi:MAG TPA: NAD(P)-dependent oxidoreductase [Ramlibacter sp.]|uniref:NAD(P)-dependent oxidoreductase n=1 Tax=Ramlibacter sp. TaxID=1917967 RepID=UPI002D1B4A28|nr:NAD(P)-dependent oxidoreductase [Ramlibacter sp.]HVZ45943.1 NAD(P)-dependent oxidoreductase [Ramlibacter sp.]